MATERITIIVDEKGARVVKRRLAAVGTTASASAQGVNLLRSALGALGGALVLRQMLRMADSFTLIQNRLRLVTTGTENLTDVTKELLDISNRTRTAFQSNAELFNRVALASKELGVEQKQLLEFTESLNQAVILSGASATEASAGLIQLSQGLASGALRGDELRSVLEQLPAVADVIAKELGVTRGELRKMGQEGAITADIVLRAFANAREELKERFGTTVATVGQGFEVLKNNVIAFVGRLNQSVGATQTIGRALAWVAENIELVAKLMGAAGLTGAVFLATSAIHAFTAAIAANPLGALLVALTYAVSLLVMFRNDIKLSRNSIVSLGDFAAATWERMREGAAVLMDLLRSALPWLTDAWKTLFGDLEFSLEGFIRGSARALDKYIGFWTAVINVIKALWSGLGPALLDLTISMMNGIIGIVEKGLNRILGAFGALASKLPGRFGAAFEGLGEGQILPRIDNVAEGALEGLDKAIVDGYAQGFESVTIFEDAVNDLFDRAEVIAQERLANQTLTDAGGPTAPTGDGAPTSQGQSRALQLINKEINEQIELLRMSNAERKIQGELRKKGVALIPAERAQYEALLRQHQVITQVSKALDQVRGAEIDLAAAQAELNTQVEAGVITLAEAKQAYALLQDEVNATSLTVQAGFQRGLNQIGRTINDFASQTEATLVNAFSSAEDALVDFVTTGKVDFKSMVDSILGDLTRLLFRMALVKALGGAGGGGALGAVAGAFGGGRQHGGGVEPGKFYMTGEDGPELFKPSVPGQIVPNAQVKQAVGAEAGAGAGEGGNVTIINVSSREEALAAIASTEGERIIVNYIGKTQREGQR